MSATLRLDLASYGDETDGVPVRVEILDRTFRPIRDLWMAAKDVEDIKLEAGWYGVRVRLPSGAKFEEVVELKDGETAACEVPLYELSPHEWQEWAYLTQDIGPPSRTLLTAEKYRGAWLRLWSRTQEGTWQVEQLPDRRGDADEDGVTYEFPALGERLYVLQVGGPQIPSKCIAIPSSYRHMVLVRPASGPAGRVHPLEVVVSSGQWRLEALLNLLRKGDVDTARDLATNLNVVAEDLLYSKVRNPVGAAVGGYFLLRTRDLDRLHDWANNLADWFPWMADGLVIHAWQLILQASTDKADTAGPIATARGRLIDASNRGFPIYSEGLRLLRDGLLLFHRKAKGDDPDVSAALERIASYVAAADWSAVTTTFTAERPYAPSELLKQGESDFEGPMAYIYDVPLSAALDAGTLAPGQELEAEIAGEKWVSKITAAGQLELPDGRSFQSPGALHEAVTGSSTDALSTWKVSSTRKSLGEVLSEYR